jgi:cyclase
MLKKRVIPVLLWKDGGLVKGMHFDHSRGVGAVLPALKVYNARDVDELFLVDVTASLRQVPPRFQEIAACARECNVPLTVGGGVTSEGDVESILKAGADKVLINSACYGNPKLIESASRIFGSQCVVVGIDYRSECVSQHCFSHAGTIRQRVKVVDWAKRVEDLGAGEILLTDCSRDGTMAGYDVLTIREVSDAVTVPVVASGGAGRLGDFATAITDGCADAVAAGSVFHFTEITPNEIKKHLAATGVAVRFGLPR